MRSLFVLIALLATSLNLFASDFKTVSLSSAFLPSQAQSSKEHTLPFLFTVPSNYEKRDVPEQQTVLWGTKEDIDAVLASKNLAKTKNGIFSLKISLNVGYDDRTKKFSGEDQMASAKNQPEFSDVMFQREVIRGFPMTTFTAVKNHRHLFLHYVAVGNAALLITYFPSETFSARDSEVWSQFIHGLRAQN